MLEKHHNGIILDKEHFDEIIEVKYTSPCLQLLKKEGKMKTLIKVCFTALAILLAVIPLVACGGGEAPPTPQPPAPSPTPTGNQPPVIKSITITPDTTTVAYGVSLTLVCNAEDRTVTL